MPYFKRLPFIRKEKIVGIIIIVPAFVLLSLVIVYPWISSVVWSLMKYNPQQPGMKFIGLGNYLFILQDARGIAAARNSLIILATSVPLQLLLGLLTALALNTSFRGAKSMHTLIMLPMLLAPAVTSFVWRYMFVDTYGIIDNMLIWLGFSPANFLVSSRHTLWSIIIVETWQFYPFMTLVILSGLKIVSVELLDAASIDGASSFQKFTKVTLPVIARIVAIGLLFRLMFTIRSFDSAFSFFETTGGPGNAALVLPVYLYRTMFSFLEFGRSSAVANVLFFLTVIVCLPLIRYMWQKDQF